MRRDPTDTILEIIAQNNQSYCQLSYNNKKIYLDTYDPICRIRNCFVCTVVAKRIRTSLLNPLKT